MKETWNSIVNTLKCVVYRNRCYSVESIVTLAYKDKKLYQTRRPEREEPEEILVIDLDPSTDTTIPSSVTNQTDYVP